jgi:TM2 domain-containing membrane protein YozV
LSNNTWYHIIGTFNNSGLSTVYLNGVSDGSLQVTNWPTGTITATPYIGTYAGYVNGQIPVAKIYNTCLTASQVAQNFQALRGRYGI